MNGVHWRRTGVETGGDMGHRGTETVPLIGRPLNTLPLDNYAYKFLLFFIEHFLYQKSR